MIEISRLSKKRWKDYRNIRLEALRKEPYAFGSTYREEGKLSKAEWQKRTDNALFAIDGDAIIGTLVLTFNNKPKHKHVAYMYSVYVKRRYRSKGVASKLIKRAIKVSKDRGILKIKLDVNPRQKDALYLYKKYGFKTVGRLGKELKTNGRLYDMLIMEKFI